MDKGFKTKTSFIGRQPLKEYEKDDLQEMTNVEGRHTLLPNPTKLD